MDSFNEILDVFHLCASLSDADIVRARDTLDTPNALERNNLLLADLDETQAKLLVAQELFTELNKRVMRGLQMLNHVPIAACVLLNGASTGAPTGKDATTTTQPVVRAGTSANVLQLRNCSIAAAADRSSAKQRGSIPLMR